jgi:lysophospholipase L1-like esterase
MLLHPNTQPQTLDENMQIHGLEGEWQWRSPLALPFKVFGFPWLEEEGVYRRLPLQSKDGLPSAVDQLANCTAGGQIRFRTDSARVAIRAKLGGASSMYHMPATGQNGFDAYVGEPGRERYAGTSRMKLQEAGYESVLFDGNKPQKLRTITINFPLYQSVKEVAIGLAPGAHVEPCDSLLLRGRLLFYGTSVTQGGCAGRPGLAYPQQLGRRLSQEVINLGFSGNGKGEPEVAKVIRQINRVDCCVLDYEGNCSTERYIQTLEPFIRLYREYKPNVPILVLSRIPYAKEHMDSSKKKERLFRRNFAKDVVSKMNSEGDAWIFFGDSSRLLGRRYDECTVDGVHPNDLGFTRMAEGILPMLKSILALKSV